MERDEIKRIAEDGKETMRARGYHTTAKSADGTMFFMHHEVLCISAEVRASECGTCFVKLSSSIKMLTLTTGEFGIEHPQFKELFEDRIMAVLERCIDLL